MTEDEDESLDEDPLEGDQAWDDDVDLVPCPICKEEIGDDVELCPHCGNFVIRDEPGSPVARRIAIAAVIVVLIAAAIVFR